ncbi:outer membrane beta-barrel protein [Saccharicrinis aurantiacus]|uniref:outer membrane beta-barrel protein n=1 Tax=Saccharicrinis aurantiacus TaxID=1849719 RepID=UPI002492622C|nr:outer membrane beta-barrel protein [Saccharicrinis aurantiacus]
MKKVVFFLSMVMLTSTFITAEAGDNKWGVRAGYQNTNIYSDGDAIGDNLGGFYIGAFREHQLIPLLSLSAGLEYTQMGMKAFDENMNLNYLGVPVGLKAKLGPISAIGGTGINFKVGEHDMYDDVKGFDIPVYLGAGFNVLMIGIEARYQWGLTDINGDSAGKFANRGFQIGISVGF